MLVEAARWHVAATVGVFFHVFVCARFQRTSLLYARTLGVSRKEMDSNSFGTFEKILKKKQKNTQQVREAGTKLAEFLSKRAVVRSDEEEDEWALADEVASQLEAMAASDGQRPAVEY